VEKKASGAPMIFRRVVESFASLRERRHLDEAKAHLEAHPHEAVKSASAQTLERLSQDVALRERAMPKVAAWLR
jgi:puromycin-sensitive aminopeptidase